MTTSVHTLFLFAVLLCCLGNETHAQRRYRVLFLGNSYTGTHSLPRMTQEAALSAGDTLIYEMNSPGGYRLSDHLNDSMSRSKIVMGGWQFVVIQGHSQEPLVSNTQFQNAALDLHGLIKQYSPCAVTMPYMTWGRKNGDASNCASIPVMCTYKGMDTSIRNRYLSLTESLNGEVSPVSVVWNYIRQHHPDIELYHPDGSHPSRAGTYAAACAFYASIFKKDPTLITFSAGLDSTEAARIRNAARLQVFNRLPEWDFKKLPVSKFSYRIGAGTNEVVLRSAAVGIRQSYSWNFGDGSGSSAAHPTHSYASNGTFTLSLTATNCDYRGTHTSVTDTVVQFCTQTPTVFTSRAWLCRYDTLWTQPADAYQWMANGVVLPETNRYLANYARYGNATFTVRATVSGCSELSQEFARTPESSGYYFQAAGNPCVGDTVAFAVLHSSGSLSGSEQIFWYKNHMLLGGMNNRDTLLITGPGKYEVKVVNPNAACPSDTSCHTVEINCGPLTSVPTLRQEAWSVYPNPASGLITLKFPRLIRDQVQIFSATGRLMKVQGADRVMTLTLSVSDLPGGLYFLRLKSGRLATARFVKY